MPTFNNPRYTTTKDERREIVINSASNKLSNSKNNANKLSSFLSEENVKKYNMILVDKGLKTPSRQTFASEDECFQEISEYFKLCNDYNIVPTISSLSVYIGVHRDTIYSLSRNPNCKYADTLLKAIDICHSYLEIGAMSGAIPPLLLIFLGKNYYSMQESTTLNLTSSLLENNNTSSTMNIVKEQIALETAQK